MLDTVDFPIAFWGAMRAGVVPVPINTLLPPDMIGYILADSRADALFVSAPLVAAVLPALRSLAGTSPDHRRAAGRDGAAADRRRAPDDSPSFWRVAILRGDGGHAAGRGGVLAVFVGFHRGAEGRAARPWQPARDGRHLWHAGAADPRGRRDVLGGQGVPRLRPRQFHDISDGGRCRRRAAAGPADPDAVLDTMQRHQPTMFGGVPTLYAALLANPRIGPGAGSDRLRRCISAGEALPADIGRRWREPWWAWTSSTASARPRCCTSSSRTAPDDIRYGTSGKPVPGYEALVLDEHGAACRTARPANWWSAVRRRPRATGTSATGRGGHFAASGPIPATPISATPRATTATVAAATRC